MRNNAPDVVRVLRVPNGPANAFTHPTDLRFCTKPTYLKPGVDVDPNKFKVTSQLHEYTNGPTEVVYRLAARVTLATEQGASDTVVLLDIRGLSIRPRGNIARVSSFYDVSGDAEKEGATQLLYYFRYIERPETLVPSFPGPLLGHSEEDTSWQKDYGLFLGAIHGAKSYKERMEEAQEKERGRSQQDLKENAKEGEQEGEQAEASDQREKRRRSISQKRHAFRGKSVTSGDIQDQAF